MSRHIPRPALKRFSEIQEIILKKNDKRKKGWNGCSIDYLFSRLQDEVYELKIAIEKMTDTTSPDIESECADVANFAMMIADNWNNKFHKGMP